MKNIGNFIDTKVITAMTAGTKVASGKNLSEHASFSDLHSRPQELI